MSRGIEGRLYCSPPNDSCLLQSCVGFTGDTMAALSNDIQQSAGQTPGTSGTLYLQLFEHCLDAVLLARPAGEILAANPAACRLFCVTEEELIALGRNGLVDGSDPRLAAALDERSRKGFTRTELTFIRPDGSKFTGELTSALFKGTDGGELACVTIRDVTDRTRISEALLESEERFRLAMEATSDGLWDWDIGTGTGYFSPGCFRMLGYEPDEFAMTIPIWYDLIHPEDRERMVTAKTDCIENRTGSFSATFRMQHKSGRWVWILGRGKALRRDDEGKALRMLGTHLDLTELKSAEDQLAASRIRYQSLFDHSSTAVWEEDFSAVKAYIEDIRSAGEDVSTWFARRPEAVIHCAGLVKVLEVNRESLNLLKVSRKEELSLNLVDYFTEESLPVFREELIALAKGETTFAREIPIRNHLGERVHLDLRLRVIPGCEQTLSNVHVSFIDISARRQAEIALQQLNEELENRVRERTRELERSNAEMETFCHSISHEMRAPIARIEGFSQLLTDCLDHGDEEGMRHCCERLAYSSRKQRGVIDALLSVHRLTHADMVIEPVDLSEIARKVLGELESESAMGRQNIAIAPEVTTLGDRRMLTICLRNLLENAVKFTSRTPEPFIEFGVITDSGEPVYFVRDNGAGFDMAFAHKLFQPFSRLHNDDEFAGSGIGLATVQRIVERHGGQIWTDSAPGTGATFYFTLGNHSSYPEVTGQRDG